MSEHLTWTCCQHCAPHVNAEIKGRDEEIESLRANLESTQKMLADRIVDYTQAQGRLEVAVRLLKYHDKMYSDTIEYSDEVENFLAEVRSTERSEAKE